MIIKNIYTTRATAVPVSDKARATAIRVYTMHATLRATAITSPRLTKVVIAAISVGTSRRKLRCLAVKTMS